MFVGQQLVEPLTEKTGAACHFETCFFFFFFLTVFDVNVASLMFLSMSIFLLWSSVIFF